jgi:UDP-N-acetylenolpyruvoylglucosamine reductase
MQRPISNYDGGITTSPQQLVYVETVEQIQAILKDPAQFPSPVRAMGSYHSLTPCASSDGTILNMSRMNRVLEVDRDKMSFTAQAGLQFLAANQALRAQGLQFVTNIEIGNMTLGSAACCQTKDALDGAEFGQVNSYVTRIKWVDPSGELQEASEVDNPELLYLVRSSYGLCGVVYEVTFRIKPMEAIHFTYLPCPISGLTEAEVARIIDASEGLVCWTVGRTAIFQARKGSAKVGLFSSLLAGTRRRLWNHAAAFVGRAIDLYIPTRTAKNLLLDIWFVMVRFLYHLLHFTGGFSLYDPDKTVNYSATRAASKYAFTFWAFPREQWLSVLRQYLEFSDQHFKKYGFRCNMPLGSYHIRPDKHSILSYSYDGEVFSIDPIHACTDKPAWDRFLQEFNEFCFQRGGIPLFNQSPFVTREHAEAAYGARWQQFSAWIRGVDPQGRMLNPFFAELLSAGQSRTAARN